MMLLDISTKKYPNTFTKVDNNVHAFLQNIKNGRDDKPRKWRCHSGGKGDIMVVSDQCIKHGPNHTIMLTWLVWNLHQGRLITTKNIHLWAKPVTKYERLIHTNRDSLDNQHNNLRFIRNRGGVPVGGGSIPADLPMGYFDL